MGKPKGKRSAVRSKATAAAAKAAPVEGAGATSHWAAVIASLLAQQPVLSEARRRAFLLLLPDAAADALGKKTRGADVRTEAARWAVQMETDLRANSGALPHYSRARFAYFLEAVRELHDAIDLEESKRKKLDKARASASSERALALNARAALERALRTFAGRRPEERAALKAALGQTDTTESLLKSIKALIDLGNEWLARSDESSKLLAEDASLTEAVLSAAANAAKSLRDAAAGSTVEGRARGQDTQPINRAEGRVLFEMMEARRLWADANELTGLVQKLVPGESVRHAFGRTPRNDDDEDLDAPPAPVAPS